MAGSLFRTPPHPEPPREVPGARKLCPVKIKRRTWELLDIHGPDRFARVVGVGILVLIVLNVVMLILETVPAYERPLKPWFEWFEGFSVLVFTLEWVLRMWACTEDPKYAHPIKGRLRYFFHPFTLIDLLAVLPWWLPFLGIDLRFVRSLRMLRLFRVLKLARYVSALEMFMHVLRRTREELLVSLLGVLMLLVVSSAAMFYVEHEVQPQKFSSIPATMWWAIATLTTVGYGDIYPETPVGRLLAGVIALTGVLTLAIPTGIFAGAFTEELRARKEKELSQGSTLAATPVVCPHCGKRPDEPRAAPPTS